MLLQAYNSNQNHFQSDNCHTSWQQKKTGIEEHGQHHQAKWHLPGSAFGCLDSNQHSLATAGHPHKPPLGALVNAGVYIM